MKVGIRILVWWPTINLNKSAFLPSDWQKIYFLFRKGQLQTDFTTYNFILEQFLTSQEFYDISSCLGRPTIVGCL